MLKQIEITVSSSADIAVTADTYSKDKKNAFICLKEVYECESFEEVGSKRVAYLSNIVTTYINNEIAKVKGKTNVKPPVDVKIEDVTSSNKLSPDNSFANL